MFTSMGVLIFLGEGLLTGTNSSIVLRTGFGVVVGDFAGSSGFEVEACC